MKITKVDIYPIRLPLIKPFVIAYDSYPNMPSIIIKIHTDNGKVGYGESVPDEHVTGESFFSTIALLKNNIIPKVIGLNPFDIEKIHQIMDKTVKNAPAAKAAIDIACYDIMGKASKQPLYNLIGGRYWDYLEIPHVLSIGEAKEMACEAKKAVENGFTTVKVKVGDSDLCKDIDRIVSIRQAVGRKIKLRIDANQGWVNSANALTVLKDIEDCNIDWIEQPILADDIRGHARIRQQIKIPLMIDEGLHGSKEMLEIINTEAADMINIKLMKCGGIYPALKLVHQAKMANMYCQVGSMVESCIASLAGAHLSLAQSNIISNEMVGPLMFSKDLGKTDYQGNKLYLSKSPGLGVEINEEVLSKLAYDVVV
ncbi:dipeptide epimerase [Alkalicella caledoniensis]|uniref:Dipeptide epimerase n=1 Tax=Alkalicella caledoniensis TaxID=2731377 RepID=A0A7G9W4Y4_ALKCA|nr:dipeptide epimerase [Alkalicella caledoniensis]QNO13746.1 dipeptide epimerase [Alkalicella caledoniensis]